MPLTPEEEQELAQLEAEEAKSKPSGLTPEEAKELAQLEAEESASMAEFAEEEPGTAGEAAEAAVSHFGEWGAAGFGSELGAAMGATLESIPGLGTAAGEGKSWIQKYRDYRDAITKRREELYEKYPKASIAGGAAGAITGLVAAPEALALKGAAEVPALAKGAKYLLEGSSKLKAAKELGKLAKAEKAAGAIERGAELTSQASKLRKAGLVGEMGKQAVTGGMYGAGFSEADLTKGEAGQFGKDIAVSAGIGGAASFLPGAVGLASKPFMAHPIATTGLVGAGAGLAEGWERGHPITGALGGLGLGIFIGHGISSPAIKHAAQLAWKGVSDFSDEALYSAKSAFTQTLNKTADFIENKFGIPAKEQIKSLLEDSLTKIARSRTDNENEIMAFVQKNLDNWGNAMGKEEALAGQGTGKIPVNQMFAKARQIIEDNTSKLSPDQKADLIRYLEAQEFVQSAKTVERKIIRPTTAVPEAEADVVQYGGKGLTGEEAVALREAEGAGIEFIPKTAKSSRMFGDVVETVEKGVLPPSQITEMPVTQVKDIRNFFGNYAKKADGGARWVANEIVDAIKLDMGEQLGKDWRLASEKYYNLKELLRTLGADTLPNDLNKVTDDNIVGITKNLERIFKEEDPRELEYLMTKFESISPGMFQKMQEKLPGIYKQERLLSQATKKSPTEQIKAMREVGIPEERISPLEKTVEEVDILKKGIETPEAAHKLVRELAQDLGPKYQARTEEIRNLHRLMRQYAPDIAQELETKGVDLSKFEGVVESREVRPSLFHLSTYKHFIEPIFIGAAISGTKAIKWLKDLPLNTLSLMPGMNNFTKFIKEHPGLETAVAKDKDTRLLAYALSQAPEDLPPALAKNQPGLLNAAQRGLNALLAKHYILTQQDPEFRNEWDEIKGLD